MTAPSDQHPDAYLASRELEAAARHDDTPELWRQFADLKVSKGSYGPAAAGYLNAGVAFERGQDGAAAVDAYQRGLDVAMRAAHAESVLMLSMRLASLFERNSQFEDAATLYENLAEYYCAHESWFLAADAADHAAEFWGKAGRDLSTYTLPAELWNRNADYWVGRDAGDEAWSRRRAEIYLARVQQ